MCVMYMIMCIMVCSFCDDAMMCVAFVMICDDVCVAFVMMMR